MVYAPKAAVRTGTVRSATVKQMEVLNMDRAAPGISGRNLCKETIKPPRDFMTSLRVR
jgi:hypothetical protein